MAQIKRKYEPVEMKKRGMTEFHAKSRKKTLKEKVIGAARYVKARAQSPEARERRKKAAGFLVKLGKGALELGERMAENQARMQRGTRKKSRKKKTKRTRRRQEYSYF